MSTEKPARLTFPGYDVGAYDILWAGRCVGFILAEFKGWRAYLFPAARDRRTPRPEGCEEVTAGTLGELRAALRKRVAEQGPWWA